MTKQRLVKLKSRSSYQIEQVNDPLFLLGVPKMVSTMLVIALDAVVR